MFFVKIVSGKFSKVIEDNFHYDKISLLKNSINRRFGLPINLLKLKFKGEILDDDKKISEYFIQSHDIIDLDLELLEINFFMKGTYQLKWYVENGVTVKELQKRIMGIIYGVIFGIDENHVLKDGELILLS